MGFNWGFKGLMRISPVGAELLYAERRTDEWTDRQTDSQTNRQT